MYTLYPRVQYSIKSSKVLDNVRIGRNVNEQKNTQGQWTEKYTAIITARVHYTNPCFIRERKNEQAEEAKEKDKRRSNKQTIESTAR